MPAQLVQEQDVKIGGCGGAIDLKSAGYDEAPILVQAINVVGIKLIFVGRFKLAKFTTSLSVTNGRNRRSALRSTGKKIIWRAAR
jgi:hypothetical protein